MSVGRWVFSFQLEDRRLVFGSWVDNIYCASNNAESACLMLSRVFDCLRRYWDSEMKEGSASCLVSRGHDLADFVPPSNIPIVSQVLFLGWIVSDDAGTLAAWQAM